MNKRMNHSPSSGSTEIEDSLGTTVKESNTKGRPRQ